MRYLQRRPLLGIRADSRPGPPASPRFTCSCAEWHRLPAWLGAVADSALGCVAHLGGDTVSDHGPPLATFSVPSQIREKKEPTIYLPLRARKVKGLLPFDAGPWSLGTHEKTSR